MHEKHQSNIALANGGVHVFFLVLKKQHVSNGGKMYFLRSPVNSGLLLQTLAQGGQIMASEEDNG